MFNFGIRSFSRLFIGAMAALSASVAFAQVPPALAGKTVKIIVPQTAAGASDSISPHGCRALKALGYLGQC